MTIKEDLIRLFDKMADDPHFNKDPDVVWCEVVNIAVNLQDELDDCRGRLTKQAVYLDELRERNGRLLNKNIERRNIHTKDLTALDEMQKSIDECARIFAHKDESIGKGLQQIECLKSKIVLTDKALVAAREIIDNSHRLAAQYREQNEALQADVRDISANYQGHNTHLKEKIETLEAELSVRKQDSGVLMKVVEAVRQCEGAGEHGTEMQFYRITTLVEDYLDTPEPPIEENCITVKVAYLEMP